MAHFVPVGAPHRFFLDPATNTKAGLLFLPQACADGGFLFRIGASPMKVFGVPYIIPEGYLSLGAAF